MEVKKMSLSRFFGVYALKVLMIPMIIVSVVLIGFFGATSTGILNLANYEETLISKSTQAIEQSDVVTSDMIPETVEYVILNKTGTEIIDEGNMSKIHIKQMWEYLESDVQPMGIDNPVFRAIESVNSICIIRYNIIVKFADPALRKVIPYPGITVAVICIAAFIISALILIKRATNRMNNELQKLMKTTEKIAEQDLNFDSEVNNFRELQNISDSLDHMRDALKTSLNEQIKLEQNKSGQISTLAHDIKIPVTVIRGNTELLVLTELDTKQKEFADDIHSAALQIENYTHTLVEVSKLDAPRILNKAETTISALLSTLEKEFLAYIKNTNITFILDNKTSLDDVVCLDSELVHRALMNILCNATEHGGNIEEITLTVIYYNNEFHFEIQDDGDGFSEESLKHGTELFFMQDKARMGDKHYGIGLSFANQVATLHGGLLSIRNNNIGGQVQIILPLGK